MSPAQANTQQVGSPITNEAYNILTSLQSKLEGMEAYRKYAQTDGNQIWQDLTALDMRAVEALTDQLERLVRDGKFRMREPGRAG